MQKFSILILLLFPFLTSAQLLRDDFYPVDTTNSQWNEETGEFTKYYDNGNIEIKGTLLYGVLHDSCRFYYENGKELMKGQFYYGTPIGHWDQYTKDGTELSVLFNGKPDESRKPEQVSIKSENKKEYTFKYPSNWIVVAKDIRGVDYFLFPWDAFGKFKDNMNITKMPIQEDWNNQDKLISQLKKQYSAQFTQHKIRSIQESETDGITSTDFIVDVTKNGTSLVSWTRCFLTEKHAYQIVMTCEQSQLERRKIDFEQMLNLFEIKK